MKYYNLNNHSKKVSFSEAVIKSVDKDGGLYFPEKIPQLNASFFDNIENLSLLEIAQYVMTPFVGKDIPANKLTEILTETLSFEFPLKKIEESIYSLELFHGPTLSFKDVGAHFMAKCLAYFNQSSSKKNQILVATSGDTGGAVAKGFYELKNIGVTLLFPKNRISKIQESQLTALGKNIKAIEVEGTFDDCQKMVKRAFLDNEINKKIHLTSANSINIARWLPQMLYYFFAYRQLKPVHKNLIFSVPSGNLGNVSAGIVAKKMGLPIDNFIISTNLNDTFPVYLWTGDFIPKIAKATISNAMDVGNPNNFVRIKELFGHNFEELKNTIFSYRYTDDETKQAIKKVYNNYNYVMDPHGAIGYLGLTELFKRNKDALGVFLATAHPAKFIETIKETIEETIDMPKRLKSNLYKKKEKITIKNYEELKSFLIN